MLLPPSFLRGAVRKANCAKEETIELMFDKKKQEAEKHVLHASQAYLQHQLYKE